MKRWRQPEDHGRSERHQHRERDHHGVDAQLEVKGHGCGRLQAAHRSSEPDRRREGAHPGDESQRRVLDQELAHQAPPARPQGQPHRHLSRAGGVARQQQSRHVRAREEQDQPDHHEHHRQERHEGAAYAGVEVRLGLGVELDTHPRERVGILLGEPRHHPVDRGLCLGERDTRAHATGDEADPAVPSRFECFVARPDGLLHHHRHPELGTDRDVRAPKPNGCDTDHGERSTVQHHIRAEDRIVAGEPRAPQGVAQDDDGSRTGGPTLLGKERAPESHRDPQGVEVVDRDQGSHDPLVDAVRRQLNRPDRLGRDRLERRRSLAHVHEVGPRERGELRTVVPVNEHSHEALGLTGRRLPEQQRPREAEDRRVGADAEADTQHHCDREAGAAGQPAKPVANVARQSVHLSVLLKKG